MIFPLLANQTCGGKMRQIFPIPNILKYTRVYTRVQKGVLLGKMPTAEVA